MFEGTELKKFIDIFENKYENEDILKLYSSELDADVKKQLLAVKLPNFDPLPKRILAVNAVASVSYSKSSIISYASTYAFSSNTAYRVINSDCANFVSQALNYAGVSMNNTGNKSTGWWCNPTSYTNYCSYSWSYADNFCDRFGMYYLTNSHRGFSSNLSAGSVIALDYEGDGSWDHVGIVTAVASSYSSSLGYTDYKVAQHSSFYEAWTSSTINNWETYESGLSVRYGIVLH